MRAWDFAATEKNATNNPDYSAGVIMSRGSGGDYLIEGCERLRASSLTVHKTVRSRAETDGTDPIVKIPQDPAQAGKDQAAQYIRELAGFTVRVHRPTGKKAERAEPLSVQAEAGNVSILRTGDPVRDAWIEPFLDEICLFPAAAHDDQVDAAADAFKELALGSTYTLAGW